MRIQAIEISRGLYSIVWMPTGQELITARGKRLARKFVRALSAHPSDDFSELRELAFSLYLPPRGQ